MAAGTNRSRHKKTKLDYYRSLLSRCPLNSPSTWRTLPSSGQQAGRDGQNAQVRRRHASEAVSGGFKKAGPRTASWKDSDESRDRRCHFESAVCFGRRSTSEVEAPGMMPMLNSELLSSVSPYARPGKGRASLSGGDSHFK